MDYMSPQLYWSIDSKEQSFPELLNWWASQNRLHRHLWPGLNTANVGTKYQPGEILNQIQMSRNRLHVDGQIHWSIKVLMQNRMNLGESLLAGPYSERAITPPFSWIDPIAPEKPTLASGTQQIPGQQTFTWDSRGAERPARWVMQYKHQGRWTVELYPSHVHAATFQLSPAPDVISVRAMDRSGNLSPAAVLQEIGLVKNFVPKPF